MKQRAASSRNTYPLNAAVSPVLLPEGKTGDPTPRQLNVPVGAAGGLAERIRGGHRRSCSDRGAALVPGGGALERGRRAQQGDLVVGAADEL